VPNSNRIRNKIAKYINPLDTRLTTVSELKLSIIAPNEDPGVGKKVSIGVILYPALRVVCSFRADVIFLPQMHTGWRRRIVFIL
jgi:hypothetical protein